METTKYKVLTAATVTLGCVSLIYALYRYKNRTRSSLEAFKKLEIKTITTEKECNDVINELRRRSSQHRALGFDCEWVSEKGRRQPVSLLQLSTYDGLCGLFRLHLLQTIPDSLKELLEDETIYKVGVVPIDDAKYLFNDYGVEVKSTLDIRHIVELCGYQAGGLATLTKQLLNITLDKHWKIRCSDWEAAELSHRQRVYAAADAHVSVYMFVSLVARRRRSPLAWLRHSDDVWATLDDLCLKYADVGFKAKKTVKPSGEKVGESKRGKERKTTKDASKDVKYPHATRSSPLYHNCFLQAPDHEPLCTCDNKKALWYVEKQLADIVCEDPLTVRLRFEPAGRAVGEVGRYYKLVKENRCVVCGSSNSYIRKNVVPREYRRFFPELLKDHSSHDVVLLCARCHRASSERDQLLRARLAHQCRAPLPSHHNHQFYEDAAAKKVRSAARALVQQAKKHVLPDARRKELEDVVLMHFPTHDQLTEELLAEACDLQVLHENSEYSSHGELVVQHYLTQGGGLLALEQTWREHFLRAMQPRHLPQLWCVTHTEDRLRIKWEEGRITEADLKLIGLTRL